MARRAVLAVGIVIAAAALPMAVVVPATSAKPGTLKLKGVVVGRTVSKGVPLITVSVREGSKEVGKLHIASADCGGLICQRGGTAKLKVGSIRRKAKLFLRWTYSGPGDACAVGAPTCKSSKSGTGTITRGSRSEAIRVNTSRIPTTKGSHFGIVLG